MSEAQEINGEPYTDDEVEALIRFLTEYVHNLDGQTTGHARAQRTLLRRMFCDIGCDYEDVTAEIAPHPGRREETEGR